MGANTLIAAEIGQRLLTQDNRLTHHPIFLVQQRKRLYGLDPAYCSEPIWLHCAGAEADAEEKARFDELEENGEKTPDEWTLTGFIDQWEFVTCCFTEAAAQHYIEQNKHNLTDPRVYVETAYRNHEFIAVREYLMQLARETL